MNNHLHTCQKGSLPECMQPTPHEVTDKDYKDLEEMLLVSIHKQWA